MTTEKNQFSPLWSITVYGLSPICITIIFYLTTGNSDPFYTSQRPQDDWLVNISYYGIVVSCLGLCALGVISLAHQRNMEEGDYNWPRLKLIDHMDGRRNLLTSIVGLGSALIPAATTLIMSARRYLRDSEVAYWEDFQPIAGGFWHSRVAAVRAECGEQPCFRIHPLDMEEPYGHQWISWLSDPLIIVLIVSGVAIWLSWIVNILTPRS